MPVYSYMDDVMLDVPIVERNIKTGVGCGHFRPSDREKEEKNHYKKKHKRNKIAKNSRRRNR